MAWNCSKNNPVCFEGSIIDPDTKNVIYGQFCACITEPLAKKYYLGYAFAEADMMKRIEELDENKIKFSIGQEDMKNGEVKPMKEFLNWLIENIEQPIQEKMVLSFFGNPGAGKSQIASTLIYELALKRKKAVYVSAAKFFRDVYNFENKAGMEELFQKVKRKDTYMLVIDDIGSEIPHTEGKEIGRLITQYNNLIREFQSTGGILVLTSNFNPIKLREVFKNDGRLFNVIYQGDKTGFVFVDGAEFRKKSDGWGGMRNV